MAKLGKVWLVGAGPGAMGLITLRGTEILNQAEVVLYDRLVNPGILLRTKANALLIDAGKTPRGQRMEQSQINRLMIRYAKKGYRVVRLKGGDPFVFGRGGEEVEALGQAKIPFEVIPGVTAGVAAPAYAGIPITHRGVSTEAVFRIGSRAEGSVQGKTLVGYMSVEGLDEFLSDSLRLGFNQTTPAALIERGTTRHQRVMIGKVNTLAQQARKMRAQAPAVVVVGKVVSLQKQSSFRSSNPLFGKRVILTASESLARGWRHLFEEQGAEVWEIPMTRVEALPVRKSWMKQILQSDWLVFTSAAAVRAFPAIVGDLRTISRSRIAAVGRSTDRALRATGLRADWVGPGPGSKEMLSAWPQRVRGKILHLSGDAGSAELVKGLRKKGLRAQRLIIYKNRGGRMVPVPVRQALCAEGADWVVLASGSAAERFRRVMPKWKCEPKVIVIGPATAKVARQVGWKVSAVAREPSVGAVLRGMR